MWIALHIDFVLLLCEHGLCLSGLVSSVDLLFNKTDGMLFGCGFFSGCICLECGFYCLI